MMGDNREYPHGNKVVQYDARYYPSQDGKGVAVVPLPEVVDKEEPRETKEVPFKELSCTGKTKIVLSILLRFGIVLGALYFFMVSLKLLSNGFILIGGRQAGAAFGNNSLLSHPLCGLMVGVLATAFLQSSSTSTSIVVTMVASNILTVPVAIPIVMGANIGTSVTSTLVAIMHAGDRKQFRDAFSAATVHDMFNWLSVFVLLPLELVSKYLFRLTSAIVDSTGLSGGGVKIEFISVITDPLANLIVQVDKGVLGRIAAKEPGAENLPLLKYWCKTTSMVVNVTMATPTLNTTMETSTLNITDLNVTDSSNTTSGPTPLPTMIVKVGVEKCQYLFHGTSLSEVAVGGIVLAIALVMLIVCLIVMVKVLRSLLAGPMSGVIQRTINTDFPGKAACLTGYVAMFVGTIATIIVQSSSVTTSTLTPLVGLGMVSVERVFPMMLGANIGTTSTSLLASLASSENKFKASLQISLCHLFFNLSGIVLWYPIPFLRRVPLGLAKFLGRTTARYRWFAIAYLIFMFIIFPLGIFGISYPGLPVLLSVGIPIIVLLIVIGVINVLQKRRPNWLPGFLQTWDFLPEPLRSLAPYDKVLMKLFGCCYRCCPCCTCCQALQAGAEGYEEEEEQVEAPKIDLAVVAVTPAVVTAGYDYSKTNPAFSPDTEVTNVVVVSNGTASQPAVVQTAL